LTWTDPILDEGHSIYPDPPTLPYSNRLRQFADFLDAHPTLLAFIDDYEVPTINIYFSVTSYEDSIRKRERPSYWSEEKWADHIERELQQNTERIELERRRFRACITDLHNFTKQGSDGTLSAVVEPKLRPDDDAYWGNMVFSFSINLTGACKRRVKVDENGQPVTRVIPAKEARPAQPEQVVEEYEYECPPFLSL